MCIQLKFWFYKLKSVDIDQLQNILHINYINNGLLLIGIVSLNLNLFLIDKLASW